MAFDEVIRGQVYFSFLNHRKEIFPHLKSFATVVREEEKREWTKVRDRDRDIERDWDPHECVCHIHDILKSSEQYGNWKYYHIVQLEWVLLLSFTCIHWMHKCINMHGVAHCTKSMQMINKFMLNENDQLMTFQWQPLYILASFN